MADHGLYVENVHGSVQVDSEYDNLLLARYGAVTTTITMVGELRSDTYCYAVPKQVNFSSPITTSAPPLLFFRAINGNLGLCKLTGGAGNWTGFTVVSTLQRDNKQITFYYEAYTEGGYSDVVMSAGPGLQVFNSSGKKLLDTGGQLLRVSSIIERKLVVDGSWANSSISSGSVSCGSDEMIDSSTCSGVGIWGQRFQTVWRISGYNKTMLVPNSGGGNYLRLDTVGYMENSNGGPAVFGDAVNYGTWGINHVNSEDRSQTMAVIIAKEKR